MGLILRLMEPFLQYLDNYKTVDADFMDINNLIYVINQDYYKNKYFLPFYVGDSKIFKMCIQPSSSNLEQKQMFPPLNSMNHPSFIKKKVEITKEIHTISDLLYIIENFQYNEMEEYNIDLKSLHQIKDELLQIHQMIGMDTLKINILHQLLYFLQNLHLNQLSGESASDFKHTVIYGPPGTGKTEIAKLMGKMYSKIGILHRSSNNISSSGDCDANCTSSMQKGLKTQGEEKNTNKYIFKKATRSDLVAGYLGQTAIKTKNVIQESLGGVLFIDEAYSLANNDRSNLDNFSKECIDTLCEALSDHKDNLMVIIAGYEEELNETFFAANKGLESRFIWRFKIDNYTAQELRDIFIKKVLENGWNIEKELQEDSKWFEKNMSHFIYFGRDMELLFSYTKIMHSNRIYGKPIECRKILSLEDLNQGFSLFLKNKKENKRSFIHSMYV